jgi:DNA-binding GntR family transcriptional regulator
VRQAIQKLCSLGLVTRQAGVSTTVTADRQQARYIQSMDTLSNLALYAKGARLRVSSRRQLQADASLTPLLRCEPGAKWLRIVLAYFMRDKVIEATTGVHPASRFSYSMSFPLAQSEG